MRYIGVWANCCLSIPGFPSLCSQCQRRGEHLAGGQWRRDPAQSSTLYLPSSFAFDTSWWLKDPWWMDGPPYHGKLNIWPILSSPLRVWAIWSVSCDGGRRTHFSFDSHCSISSRLHTCFTLAPTPMLLLHTTFTLVPPNQAPGIFTLVSDAQLLNLMIKSWGEVACRPKVPLCFSVSEQSAVKIAIYIQLKGLLAPVTEWVLQSALGGSAVTL